MISRICRITHHPIANLSEEHKLRFVIGLGCVLHHVSNGHPNMRVLFEQWGYSILRADVSDWFKSDDIKAAKRALGLYRRGVHFFRVKRQFYFDCFYLTESYNASLLSDLNGFLTENGSTVFTKEALKETFGFFCEGRKEFKIDDELYQHRQNNLYFSKLREFRVLVVATVSAGKSTLINALTGHDFNRSRNGVCTTQLCKIHTKPERDGISYLIEKNLGYDTEIEAHSSDDFSEVAFYFASTLSNQRLCLIDTPGINNAQNKDHYSITSEAIKDNQYDLILFISNGQYNGTNDERRLLELVRSSTQKPVLFVLNQLDTFKSKTDDIGKMIAEYKRELKAVGFSHPEVYPLSAKFALHLRTESQLEEEELEELASERKRFNKSYYDLQSYEGPSSTNELERSGIIRLEKAIVKHLNQTT